MCHRAYRCRSYNLGTINITDLQGYKEPIVLVCLTNHALDQFLEDLLDLFPDTRDRLNLGQGLRYNGANNTVFVRASDIA